MRTPAHIRFLPLLTVFLVCAAASATAEVSMSIDSVSGVVEIQKAGQARWSPAVKSALLKNNDAIRVMEKSYARLKAANGDVMSLRAGTQMLVNLYENPQAGLVSRHVTVFVGAVFFVIQKALPRQLTNFEDTKVYTPTAVVAVRGTSFLVQVEKGTGKTATKVVSGTVLVRNILRNSSVILSAPYQSVVVGMNTDPSAPVPLMDQDVAEIKAWTPASIIDKETSQQVAQTKQVRDQVGEAFDDKITILPFINRSTYQGEWNIGERLAQYIAVDLRKVRAKSTVAVEGTPGNDPLETGRRLKARFVVTGDIESFDIVQYAEVSAKADAYRELNVAKVRLRLELVDVSTRQVLFEGNFDGEVSAKNEPQNHWSQVRSLTFSPDDAKFASSILGQSVKQAVEQSVAALSPYLHN